MYQRLKEEIENIWIVDDHGHPGITEVSDSYPNPPEDKMPFSDIYVHPRTAARGFAYTEELIYEAYEKFYGFTREQINDPGQEDVLREIYEKKRLDLGNFIEDVMKESKVEFLMANYHIPESLVTKKNITLVPGLDPLLFPFNAGKLFTRPMAHYYLAEFGHISRELKTTYGLPNEYGFDEYMQFVDRVLDGYRKNGAPAVKFMLAYVRSLYFPNMDDKSPEAMFSSAQSGNPGAYLDFQSYLFWHIMRRLSDMDLPVQIHAAVTDNAPSDFDPMNLENILRDKKGYHTKIVLLHGGSPAFKSTTRMLLAQFGLHSNNIYVDFSGRILYYNHPKIVAEMLHQWLIYPELRRKVIYGSDVLFGTHYIYTCARMARDGVYYALEGLLDDGIIDQDEAIKTAKNILRNNAIKLYRLPLKLA